MKGQISVFSVIAAAEIFFFPDIVGGQNGFSVYGSLRSGSQNEIYDWVPPDHIRKYYPWHTMGFDYEGRLVFLNEFGKWNIKELAENYKNDLEDFFHHFEQGLQMFADLALQPKVAPNGTEYGPQGTALILDLEGFNPYRIASPQVMTLLIELFTKLANTREYLAYGFFVNLNGLGQSLLNNAVRPILPNIFSKIQVYGTDKKEYIPAIQKLIPRDQLPPRFGGFENFTYLASYGQSFNHHLNR